LTFAAYLTLLQKDLVRRLRKLCKVLESDQTIDPDSPEWPGIAATAMAVFEKIKHKDKEVRLYAVVACMEIFSIYAPNYPYDYDEALDIFRQTIQQIDNLSHTTNPSMANYQPYAHILSLFAQVRIGCVLVEMCNNEVDQALDLLRELVHTLLNLVRNEHSEEIKQFAVLSVVAILDEYNNNVLPIPLPLLDEILFCIGQGPTVQVANPNYSKTNKLAMMDQPNPAYATASAVIKATLNRTATPVANLLNGLLQGQVDDSSISTEHDVHPNVYDIVFELHRVAPQILTTVIGTVAHGLSSPHVETRLAVTTLLGRLLPFCTQFRPCFRDWLGRQHDVEVPIRKSLVSPLVQLLQTNAADIASQANQALEALLHDPNLDVRLDVIYQVSDTVYRLGHAGVSPSLLRAVGARVQSKYKQERKNALTGLAQVYFRRYARVQLEKVEMATGGEDVDVPIAVVLKALHDTCHLQVRRRGRRSSADERGGDLEEELYGWIPKLVFESAFWNDKNDSEMRSRVVKCVDECLLGNDLSSHRSLTPTSRAVGLTMIFDSLRSASENLLMEPGRSGAFKHMVGLLEQRAFLQKSISDYLDARSQVREHEKGK
jgi:sister-chromatid-cohesion protein PDS5